jgi:hypothetical protein
LRKPEAKAYKHLTENKASKPNILQHSHERSDAKQLTKGGSSTISGGHQDIEPVQFKWGSIKWRNPNLL